MSNKKGGIPPRWLHCPRKSIKLIQNKFLAFKTPLSNEYDDQVPEDCRFTVDMLFKSLKSQKIKMGLWIDLTYTNRFYNKADVEANNCAYSKIQCRGHGETPTLDQAKTFIALCKRFVAQHPLEIIGVHCTHGFNRTGFLLISYLVDTDIFNLDAAVLEFATARPPGIYKHDYIIELCKRYDSDIEDVPETPARPAWCLEYDDDDEDIDDNEYDFYESTSTSSSSKCKKKEYINKNPVFMEGVPGVQAILNHEKATGIQRRVQQICGWKSKGFPGSQPVSMDRANIRFLSQKPYRVSWKADGTRYMMLIQGDGEIYFIDRDNSIFQVSNLSFPHIRHVTRTLADTLLDGEMVIDVASNVKYPRYLVYDIVMYDGKDVSKLSFYPDRYEMIKNEVIEARYNALKDGRIKRELEPFSVRLKEFWDITQTKSLLSEKFEKKLGHKPDGLIFQPSKESYTPGQTPEVLKWKPPSLNSVDFRLKIVQETREGMLPIKYYLLYVGGREEPFSQVKYFPGIKEYNNKIIECKFEGNNVWTFMRERTDKSFPNSEKTAMAVCQSIEHPVTPEMLITYIDRERFVDDCDLMPPPTKRPR